MLKRCASEAHPKRQALCRTHNRQSSQCIRSKCAMHRNAARDVGPLVPCVCCGPPRATLARNRATSTTAHASSGMSTSGDGKSCGLTMFCQPPYPDNPAHHKRNAHKMGQSGACCTALKDLPRPRQLSETTHALAMRLDTLEIKISNAMRLRSTNVCHRPSQRGTDQCHSADVTLLHNEDQLSILGGLWLLTSPPGQSNLRCWASQSAQSKVQH